MPRGLNFIWLRLKNAYTELLERIKNVIFEAFEVDCNSEGRNSIASRADNLWSMVSERQLKAFCGRLKDTHLPDTQWIESIANLVISDSPSSWADSDENVFQYEIAALVSRFKHVESIYHEVRNIPQENSGILLLVTRAEGDELAEVVYSLPQEDPELANIEEGIRNLLVKHDRRLSLAAIARMVYSQLSDTVKEQDKKETEKEN